MLLQLKKWCRHSETIAWGYSKIITGAVLGVFDVLGTLITDPDVKSAISMFQFPAYVCLGLAIMGAITIYLRLRPGKMDTD